MNVVGSDVELRDLSEIRDLRKAGSEVGVLAELLLVGHGIRKSKNSPSGGQNQTAFLIDFIGRRHAFFRFAVPGCAGLTFTRFGQYSGFKALRNDLTKFDTMVIEWV